MIDLARVGPLIAQLQGALGGNRIIRGTVSSAGAVVAGAGFTAARTGTGLYTVTFDTPFSAVPSVPVGAGATVAAYAVRASAVSTTAVSVVSYLVTTGVLTDAEWHFIAAG